MVTSEVRVSECNVTARTRRSNDRYWHRYGVRDICGLFSVVRAIADRIAKYRDETKTYGNRSGFPGRRGRGVVDLERGTFANERASYVIVQSPRQVFGITERLDTGGSNFGFRHETKFASGSRPTYCTNVRTRASNNNGTVARATRSLMKTGR